MQRRTAYRINKHYPIIKYRRNNRTYKNVFIENLFESFYGLNKQFKQQFNPKCPPKQTNINNNNLTYILYTYIGIYTICTSHSESSRHPCIIAWWKTIQFEFAKYIFHRLYLNTTYAYARMKCVHVQSCDAHQVYYNLTKIQSFEILQHCN